MEDTLDTGYRRRPPRKAMSKRPSAVSPADAPVLSLRGRSARAVGERHEGWAQGLGDDGGLRTSDRVPSAAAMPEQTPPMTRVGSVPAKARMDSATLAGRTPSVAPPWSDGPFDQPWCTSFLMGPHIGIGTTTGSNGVLAIVGDPLLLIVPGYPGPSSDAPQWTREQHGQQPASWVGRRRFRHRPPDRFSARQPPVRHVCPLDAACARGRCTWVVLVMVIRGASRSGLFSASARSPVAVAYGPRGFARGRRRARLSPGLVRVRQERAAQVARKRMIVTGGLCWLPAVLGAILNATSASEWERHGFRSGRSSRASLCVEPEPREVRIGARCALSARSWAVLRC